MTPKDLRDIAAYLFYQGDSKYFPCWKFDGEKWQTHEAMNLPELLRMVDEGETGFRLSLRSIGSLTDKEFGEFFTLAFPGNECQSIERTSNCYYNLTSGSIWLQVECGPNYTGFSMEAIIDGSQSGRIEAGAAVAYLQSIGIYVPGTINPDYVELQP